MIPHNVAGILALAMLTGCTPLHQAPLVYSSKTTLGVDIAATSTETPGMSFSVGFKSVDAAYVPIAVAKECPASLGRDCLDKIFELKTIQGTSSDGDEHQPTPKELRADEIAKEFKNALDEADMAKKANSIASTNLSSLQSRQAELSALERRSVESENIIVSLRSEKAAIEKKHSNMTISPEVQSQIASLDEKTRLAAVGVMTQEQKDELNGIKVKIENANASLNDAATRSVEKEARVKELSLKALTPEMYKSQITRSDAYSVYGRFESDSNLNSDQKAASVGLGKVFSTGVASQNLADGLRHYYKNLGVAACYDAVGKLKTNSTTEAQVVKWIAECKDVGSDTRDGF